MAPLDQVFTVDLRGLAEGRSRMVLSESGSNLKLPEDQLVISSDVVVELTLDRTGSLITAKGDISAIQTLVCARCLEPFECDVAAAFNAVFRMGQNDLQLEDEEDTPVEFGNNWVSFAPSIRESLILVVPIKPLCREDCRGLCQRCGKNLNYSHCDCPQETVDPRWNALKTFLEDNRGE
jgi:uncharacterized protein